MRALRAVSVLTAVITGAALVLLVIGLALSARPELASGLGLVLTWRDGLALALGSGAVAIGSAILWRVAQLLAVSD